MTNKQHITAELFNTFPVLLGKLNRDAFTGVAELLGDDERLVLYFLRGRPVFAEAGPVGLSLGSMLLASGRISAADLQRAVARLTESLVESEEKRMGECLVELGILSSSEVYAALNTQLDEKILHCFHWQSFSYTLDPSVVPTTFLLESRPVVDLIEEGMRRHFSARRLKRLLAPFTGYAPALRVAPDKVQVPRGRRLPLREISDDVDLTTTLLASSDVLGLQRLVLTLWASGQLEFSRQRGARIKALSRVAVRRRRVVKVNRAAARMERAVRESCPTWQQLPALDPTASA